MKLLYFYGGDSIKLMKKIFIMIIITELLSFSSFAMKFPVKIDLDDFSEFMNYYSKGVTYNGHLNVQGSRLLNKYGEILQLKGMSSHGILWYPEYTNYRSLMTTKDYGANVFRIAMYTSERDGYIGKKEESKDALYMALENALGTDMYVIIDWHILRDSDPNTYVDEAVDFFAELSSRYPNNPAIIYEICNEPNGEISWENVKKYANTVIPEIRKNSPNALILVGSPRYSTDIRAVAKSPLEYDNIIYSYHFYTALGSDYKSTIDFAINNRIPIFVSEWGMKKDEDSGEFDFDEASGFLDYLEKKDISWINWSLSNKKEDYSVIKHTEEKLSHWSVDQLTENGKFVFQYMAK
jgi:aryl-phospho-beta-D-glucosidase BglC (GH1 family)